MKDLSAGESSEMHILQSFLEESIAEKRKRRRWNIFFRSVFAILIILLILLFFRPNTKIDDSSKIALINISGVISSSSDVNTKDITDALSDAFKSNSKIIVLNINSPGGSPVVSNNIFQEILYLKSAYPSKKIFAVCNDICASGGYYIAASADKIYANKMSIVGSIGVKMDGFGFVGAIKKIGVSRRLYISGSNKGFLDPFSKISENQEKSIQIILDQAHNVFISSVLKGRGSKLDISKKNIIFSGEPFDGIQAKKFGLIDEYGSINTVKRDVGINGVIDYTKKRGFLDKVATSFGAEINTQIQSLYKTKLN
jgi:protease IV